MVADSAGRCPNAPLAGGGVLDLTPVLTGPWATHLLADVGAEMTKAERVASAITPADGGRRTLPSAVKSDIGVVLAEQRCC
jgi:crotonobetainyl-CoA:carnitine CoA-transferase CaiB-like acyl-CoA transferase